MSIPISALVAASRLRAVSLTVLSFLAVAGPAVAEALDTVEVHGLRDRLPIERALTPGGVTVLDTEGFYRRPVLNMADSLRYVPGVWAQSSTGGDALFISSRGSNLDATGYDNNGVKLLQDGLPVTAADGNNHNRFIDPLTARHAVVARGANALTYGASTLGGAIDFHTPTARDGTPAQLYIQGGSHGLISGRLTGGVVAGAVDAQLTVERRRRDGYRAHSRQSRLGVYANAGWELADDLSLRLYLTHVDNDEELAGALTRAQFNADPRQANPSAVSGHYQWNVRSNRLAARGHWQISSHSHLEFGLSYEDQSLYHPIVDKVMVGQPPVEVFSLLKATDQRTAGGMLRYHLVLGHHDLLAGLNLADTRESGGNYRNDGGRRNGLTGHIDNHSDSLELFLVDRWSLAPAWTLIYGAQGVITRRDVRNTDVASGDLRNPRRDYQAFNPRIGVIHALRSGSEAYASLGRLYEAPTTFQMEDDVRGQDATLEAMRGTVIELGLRRGGSGQPAAAGWYWDVSGYYAAIRDEILSVDDPAAPGTSLSTNIDRTVHAGLELLVGGRIELAAGHHLEPVISASYNAFHFDDDAVYGDNRLPAAPRYAIRGELMVHLPMGVYAGPTFDLIGARHADFSNDYRIGAHGLVGLRAGVEARGWTLFAELSNLFDRPHVASLSVRDRASASDALLQPGAPRSLHLGLRRQF